MCMKTPKVATVTDKPPSYLVNPLLNPLGIGAGADRNSLRTDMGIAPRGGRVQAGLTIPINP